jgi:anti-anti-sigma factor
MKCYQTRPCSEKQRQHCYVWKSFADNPDELENVKCWVLKGAYQHDNRKQLVQCQSCEYYQALNIKSGIDSSLQTTSGRISCQGVLNNDRTRVLEQVWASIPPQARKRVVLQLGELNNIYSCGLGMLIRMHQETEQAGGILVVEGASGYVEELLHSSRLDRILNLSKSEAESHALFEKFEQSTPPTTAAPAQSPSAQPLTKVPCFEYWNNHNPKNATNCDECFQKKEPSSRPCWIVDGVIEGVSFEYVNEECEQCEYYRRFGGTVG